MTIIHNEAYGKSVVGLTRSVLAETTGRFFRFFLFLFGYSLSLVFLPSLFKVVTMFCGSASLASKLPILLAFLPCFAACDKIHSCLLSLKVLHEWQTPYCYFKPVHTRSPLSHFSRRDIKNLAVRFRMRTKTTASLSRILFKRPPFLPVYAFDHFTAPGCRIFCQWICVFYLCVLLRYV